MRIKELLENRHGYDDAGYSLAPGHDEGEPVYSKYHDRIGDGGPRNYRQQQHQIDVPHDVHINGKKWKTFGSHSHASNVAKKIKGATVHKSLEESATAGATSSANIATVVNPDYANNANNKPVKSVNALDQDEVSLFGAPMENIKNASGKKAAIIKRR